MCDIQPEASGLIQLIMCCYHRPWPITTLSTADGRFYVLDSGIKLPSGGSSGDPAPVYFYLYDGHINFADFSEGSSFAIYLLTF